ncbi:hypothetical protein ECAE60S_02001 [Eoetvoesiella caeni]
MLGAQGKQVGIVLAVPDKTVLLGQDGLGLRGRIQLLQRLGGHLFGERFDALIALDTFVQRPLAGLLDQSARVAPG